MNENEEGQAPGSDDKRGPIPPRIVRNPLITPAHLARKAYVYVRQSSPKQVEEHQGSAEYQKQLFEIARALGWAEPFIKLVNEDQGKSSRAVQQRQGWQEILSDMAKGLVGAVFIVTSSRMNRVYENYAEFRKLAARHNVLVFMDNRLVNLRDLSDTIYSNIQAFLAETTNMIQTEHMRRSRLAKAQQGQIVVPLPIGWLRHPDGSCDKDAEVAPIIDLVFSIFREKKSLHGTVRELRRLGKLLPRRRKGRIEWVQPTVVGIRQIVLGLPYSGVVVYGKSESAPELGILPNGQTARRSVPEDQWLKFPNRIPAYVTLKEQSEFREIIKKNTFPRKNHVGNGPSLCQGLIFCSDCKSKLIVNYGAPGGHRYVCSHRAACYAEEHGFSIAGRSIDEVIQRCILSLLESPPLTILNETLEESRKAEKIKQRDENIERQRLEREVKDSRERFRSCNPSRPRAFLEAEKQLEEAIKNFEDFKLRTNSEQASCEAATTAAELEDLCRVVSDIPSLWRNPYVTHQDRKEIIQCLVEKIVVATTSERIDAVIHWSSGQQNNFFLWRRAGFKRMAEELHNEGLSIPEIQRRLATGQTSTGQRWDITTDALYMLFKRLGLKPHLFPSTYRAAKERARKLYESGVRPQQIADTLTKEGFRTLYGKFWTSHAVYNTLRSAPRQKLQIDQIQWAALRNAKSRGLSNRETAEEFEEKQVPRFLSAGPWTAEAVKQRWRSLKKCSKASKG